MSSTSSTAPASIEASGESRRRLQLIFGSLLAVVVLLFAISNGLNAADDAIAAADLSGSTKTASSSKATPGSTVQFTIVVSNSGTLVGDSTTVYLTDTLPVGMSYLTETIQSDAPAEDFAVNGQVMTWTALIPANTAYTLQYSVDITDTVMAGTTLTNQAEIGYNSSVVALDASVLVTDTDNTLYMPIGYKPLPKPDVSATNPNSVNSWSVSWNDVGAAKYEIQESQASDFSGAPIIDNGSSTSYNVVEKPVNTTNQYYYRVRGVTANGAPGGWSDPVEVVGAYYDDFKDSTSNWAVRRTTLIEDVTSFYEKPTEGWFILRVEDSWDWGIASPMAKAPKVPYVIEYRMMPANRGNLVSQGVVFGADFPGSICDPFQYPTVEQVYSHVDCFNEFYNMNTIWYGKLKLQWERIDQLVWCPGCGGSPMKRLGDVFSASDPVPNTSDNGFNTWKIEVRSDSIRVFANGAPVETYNDTRHVNNPYFGIFASTDEYSNSTARFDYFRVTPLDS
ncbi:MAG: hypothetical protein QNJ45_13385 [Ardenticatenaceae bacterium]|nr:hypothetical protein [Ardenticatenaceae bacterium]